MPEKSPKAALAEPATSKEGDAPIYHRAMDGRMYTILSTDVISPACSIKDGNLIAAE